MSVEQMAADSSVALIILMILFPVSLNTSAVNPSIFPVWLRGKVIDVQKKSKGCLAANSYLSGVGG
jgi:hypothetical protein